MTARPRRWVDPRLDEVFRPDPADNADWSCDPEWQPRDVTVLPDINQYQETT